MVIWVTSRACSGHVPEDLLEKPVSDLKSRDLRGWRDALGKQLRPSTVNRTATALKAVLNLAADRHESITSRDPWEKGLSALPDASVARNVILTDEVIRKIIASAFQISENLGLLVELAAITGARYSQIAGLRVRDLQDENGSPRRKRPRRKRARALKESRIDPSRFCSPLLDACANRLRKSNSMTRW